MYLFLLLSLATQAQEIETEMSFNPEIVKHAALEKSFEPRAPRGGGSIPLPFVDDFSHYSLPTANPDIPLEWQMWSDNQAHVNNSFPINPPTIGVATLDGLNAGGYPWDFSNPTGYGPADTLTSLPINLAPYSLEDNVYLHFYYQPEGRGNFPDEADSLVVEFFSPDDDAWFHVWSVPGQQLTDFQQVFIQVTDTWFFRDGFKFRFSNYATLSGNVDHWHIDYVVLDSNVNPEDFDLIDVAFVHPISSILTTYTSIPWTHFVDNAPARMKASVQIDQANLNEDRNIASGFRVDYEGSNQASYPTLYLNTTGNGYSQFESSFPVGNAPAEFVYDTSVNDTCATFDVRFITTTTPDQNRNNDTLYFQQHLANYYAYDDGSAERGYAVAAIGGKLAMKYVTYEADSLLGFLIHFTPIYDDTSEESFLLRVWGDNGGAPGNEIGENFQFQYPLYYDSGHDLFKYYALDEPVLVNGTFYIGWVQESSAKISVGNDKNNNNNIGNLFYTEGTGASWEASEISGSVMIRPVFRSGKQDPWNGLEEQTAAEVELYPNPVQDVLTLKVEDFTEKLQVRLHDLQGRLMYAAQLYTSSTQIPVQELSAGIYICSVYTASGTVVFRDKILKD
jgi:hypothetical protein